MDGKLVFAGAGAVFDDIKHKFFVAFGELGGEAVPNLVDTSGGGRVGVFGNVVDIGEKDEVLDYVDLGVVVAVEPTSYGFGHTADDEVFTKKGFEFVRKEFEVVWVVDDAKESFIAGGDDIFFEGKGREF